MGNVLRNLDWSILLDVILRIIPALLCITIHELSHGLVAYKLGDNTAKNMGRLTLNPIKHLDKWGLLMMAIFRFGWAKPVPVDMRNFENPKKGMAITAIAGPVSNIILAAVILIIYGILSRLVIVQSTLWDIVMELLIGTAWLSVGLAVFNLIPIPPLDGSKVLFSFLSDESYYKLMRVERYGIIIMVIVISTGVMTNTIGQVTSWIFDKLFNLAVFAFNLVNRGLF